MKKTTKIVTILLAVILTALIAAAPVSAAMEYRMNGFRFELKNNYESAIRGYIGESPDMVIPEKLLSKNVTTINSDAFRSNTFITSVDFTNATHLETIGVYAFSGCTSLAGNVTLPASVTSIGYYAFQYCPLLSSVTIPSQITILPLWCFADCNSLSTVTLPDTLQEIESGAFAFCPNLTYVNIPASVTTIDEAAFYQTTNVTLGVWSNTYGHQYAVAHNIPYVLLDAPQPQPIPYLLGDATGDGYVNVRDVTAIQRHVAEFTLLTGVNFVAADIDGNSIISIDDGTTIQRYLAEFDVNYPVGQEQSYLPE